MAKKPTAKKTTAKKQSRPLTDVEKEIEAEHEAEQKAFDTLPISKEEVNARPSRKSSKRTSAALFPLTTNGRNTTSTSVRTAWTPAAPMRPRMLTPTRKRTRATTFSRSRWPRCSVSLKSTTPKAIMSLWNASASRKLPKSLKRITDPESRVAPAVGAPSSHIRHITNKEIRK